MYMYTHTPYCLNYMHSNLGLSKVYSGLKYDTTAQLIYIYDF